jgi:hypothetical protein
MTTEEKAARRKRSQLELAEDLRNVSRPCRLMGDSRQQFYEIRRWGRQIEVRANIRGASPFSSSLCDSLTITP